MVTIIARRFNLVIKAFYQRLRVAKPTKVVLNGTPKAKTPLQTPMDRKQKILFDLNINKLTGIEIGPLHRPLVKKSEATVFYVDYASADFLRDRYKNDPNVDAAKIVEIDGIWGGNTLLQALGDHAPVDYIVASHVIEHVPDLVGWFNELYSVLKAKGEVRLAIPDKRYSFDYHRNISTISEIIEAYFLKPRIPMVRQVLDHFLNVLPVCVSDAWEKKVPLPPLKNANKLKDALGLARDINVNQAYHDVHCWVFTPLSFAHLMIELSNFELISFKCLNFYDTEKNTLEFFVHMSRCDDKYENMNSWQSMLEKVINAY